MTTEGLVALAAALAVLVPGGLAALGQANVAAKAVEAVGKNPEAEAEIRVTLMLGAGIAETGAIYGLLIAFILLFVY